MIKTKFERPISIARAFTAMLLVLATGLTQITWAGATVHDQSSETRSGTATIKLWTYPDGVQSKSFQVTQKELENGLIDWGSPKDAARQGAKETFELLSGGDRIVDIISDLTTGNDPFAAFLGAAALSVAIALGAGIGAIVNRVRIENGSNIAIFNTIPGAKIEIEKASEEFDVRMLSSTGSNHDKSILGERGDIASSTKADPLSGIVLYLAPSGGRSQLRGILFLKMTLPTGRVHYFELHVNNRVGAGQRSEYVLVSSDNVDRTGPRSYYRGRGTTPKVVRTGSGRNRKTRRVCSDGKVLEGSLCRTKCRAGYTGRSSTCSRSYRFNSAVARGTKSVQPLRVSSTRSNSNVTRSAQYRDQFGVRLRLEHTNNSANKRKDRDQRKDLVQIVFQRPSAGFPG